MRPSILILIVAMTSLTCAAAPRASYGPFGLDIDGMNRGVRPGNDFYSYADGNWMKRTVIPADQGEQVIFMQTQQHALAQTRTILEDAARTRGDKIGDFYTSFLGEGLVDGKGIAPLRSTLGQLSAVTDKTALAAYSASLERQGVGGLFAVPRGLSQAVSPDDRTPEVEAFHIRQGGLGLPSRDYYVGQGTNLQDADQAYLGYVTKLLTLVGVTEPARRAADVIAFEGSIAKVHWSLAESREAEKVYNSWRPADFVSNAPGFPWSVYLQGLGVATQPRILVAQPSAVKGEAQLWADTPLTVLKDHQLVRLLDHYAPYLSKPFVDAAFAFHGVALEGLTEDEPRWRRGAELVSNLMRDAVGQEYVRRYFPPATEAAADILVHNVVTSWHERLAEVSWMEPTTRAAAQRKLDAMLVLVGHTHHWREYGSLTIARDDLLGNVRRAFEVEYAHQLSKLEHPSERDDWDMPSMRSDANEDPVKNHIILPAAIFQPPYFDPAADLAVNYGAIGSFIGHEISHSFDDQGRKYDASGRLADWWTPEDVRRYTERTAMLVRQYDAYEPLPGLHMQGAIVLGETMADLGGITVSHRAYHIALADRPAPVLAGFTGEQRFYLGWAQIWRAKYRDAALREQLLSDPHPPGAQRAIIVRNRPEWYQAFDVKPGDHLYLPPEQRVEVW